MKKAVIFAPFWRQAGHVGNYRVDRFLRWLAADGFSVVIVRAGSVTQQRSESWGVEMTVRDPLGLHNEIEPDSSPLRTHRANVVQRLLAYRPIKLRRWLAYYLFIPDPDALWARAAAGNTSVLEQAQGASLVISSSPPESAHVGSARLAKKIKAKLIIDMRDGWLDEPLKPLLHTSRLRRRRESKIESAILQQADKIFVTSSIWKSLLAERLPFALDKTVVMTNGYPPEGLFALQQSKKRAENDPLRLLHAGRFTGSRLTQKLSYLLEPILLGLENTDSKGIITLLGRLKVEDFEEIKKWRPQFESKGWSIEVKDAVARDEMMQLLGEADGLLLLSASQAAIPSKLFEYLPTGKSILAVTSKSSAIWELGQTLPQLFPVDYMAFENSAVAPFLDACTAKNTVYKIPEQFSEKALSEIFFENV